MENVSSQVLPINCVLCRLVLLPQAFLWQSRLPSHKPSIATKAEVLVNDKCNKYPSKYKSPPQSLTIYFRSHQYFDHSLIIGCFPAPKSAQYSLVNVWSIFANSFTSPALLSTSSLIINSVCVTPIHYTSQALDFQCLRSSSSAIFFPHVLTIFSYCYNTVLLHIDASAHSSTIHY